MRVFNLLSIKYLCEKLSTISPTQYEQLYIYILLKKEQQLCVPKNYICIPFNFEIEIIFLTNIEKIRINDGRINYIKSII